MINDKVKTIGKHTLKYIIFLVAVMAWMIILGPKETLTANEEQYVQEFIAQLDSEPVTANELASEVTPTQTTSNTSTVSDNNPVQSNTKYGIINENSVNVRTGPGLDYPAVRQLFQGDEVELVEEVAGSWWKIAIQESLYYVKNDYVNVQSLTGLNQ